MQVVDRFSLHVTGENLNNSPLSPANLNAGLLRSSRRDLGMILMLRGIHWESHHRGCDRRWRSVVVRDLHTHVSNNQPVRGRLSTTSGLRVVTECLNFTDCSAEQVEFISMLVCSNHLPSAGSTKLLTTKIVGGLYV